MKRSKEDFNNALTAATEMYEALSMKKRGEYLGHLNEICLCLEDGKAEVIKQEREQTELTQQGSD